MEQLDQKVWTEDKIQGLGKYWGLIGADLICSVKRLFRYVEMDPSQSTDEFGWVPWTESKYSREQLLALVKSPDFATIFEHYLNLGDAAIKASKETEERDAKRRKLNDDERQQRKREEGARLSQMTRTERKLELDGMKLSDLKNLYRNVSGSGNKWAVIEKILEHETRENKLKH